MTTLAIVDPIEDPAWDAFVAGHPWGQVYHLSGWKRALEASFRHMKGYYLVLREGAGGKILAGIPAFKVSSWLTGKRLVSLPFATLSDPLVSDAGQAGFLLDGILRLSASLRCSRVEIRTLLAHAYMTDPRFDQSNVYVHHYLDLGRDLDSLRSGFHRTCVRQRIAKAERSGIELEWADGESALKDFYRLLIRTRRKNALPVQPYSFIKSLWDAFRPGGRLAILLARKDGPAVAGLLLLKHGNRVSAEFAVSDESFNPLSPVHLAFWHAIRAAREEGYEIFDFGRTSPRNQSLMEFKGRWGTQAVPLRHFFHPAGTARDAGEKEGTWGYRMTRAALSAGRSDLVHRAISAFCYRHLG